MTSLIPSTLFSSLASTSRPVAARYATPLAARRWAQRSIRPASSSSSAPSTTAEEPSSSRPPRSQSENGASQPQPQVKAQERGSEPAFPSTPDLKRGIKEGIDGFLEEDSFRVIDAVQGDLWRKLTAEIRSKCLFGSHGGSLSEIRISQASVHDSPTSLRPFSHFHFIRSTPPRTIQESKRKLQDRYPHLPSGKRTLPVTRLQLRNDDPE